MFRTLLGNEISHKRVNEVKKISHFPVENVHGLTRNSRKFNIFSSFIKNNSQEKKTVRKCHAPK